MVIAITLWSLLNTSLQSLPPLPREPTDVWYRAHLPVTMKVTQDIEVGHFERHRRGRLEMAGDAKPFTIKNGETFQMTKLLGEGECRIRFLKEEYDLVACWWLEGFTHRESDIYQPVAGNGARGQARVPNDRARRSN